MPVWVVVSNESNHCGCVTSNGTVSVSPVLTWYSTQCCVHVVCCVRVTDLRWLLYCDVCHGGCVSWVVDGSFCCVCVVSLSFFCVSWCSSPVLPPPTASLLSFRLSLLLLPIIVVHCGVCVHVVPLCCSRCLWFVVHSFPLSRV